MKVALVLMLSLISTSAISDPISDCFLAGFHAQDEDGTQREYYRYKLLSGPFFKDGHLTRVCYDKFNEGAQASGQFD